MTARNRQLLEKGKLITIDNLIDTTTGTVKLRARVREPRTEFSFPTNS